MTTNFYHWLGEGGGISAFYQDRMIMSFGSPMVSLTVSLQELQAFICTLEKAVAEEPNLVQQSALDAIRCVLQVALTHHKHEYEDFIQEAPTGPDLEEYMLAYARAIKDGAL